MKPLALVTGATGAIGPVLVGRLLAEGYRVRALVRRPPDAHALPGEVQPAEGDITDPRSVEDAMSGVEIVFHLAARLHINNPDPGLSAEYRRVNVDGTECVVRMARAAGVRRVVFFSTISVYGASKDGEIQNERSPLGADSLYAQSKCQAEAIALDATQSRSGEPLCVVLRLAAVYGPRVKGNYASMLSALQRGRFVPIGGGRNRRTLVYDQDVAAAALLAAEHPQAAGRVYNVTDGQIHTIDEIVISMCKALGRRPPRYHLPAAPVRLAFAAAESAYRLAGRRAPVGRWMVDKFLEDVAVSGDRIRHELGFRAEFGLDEGWSDSLRQAGRPHSSVAATK